MHCCSSLSSSTSMTGQSSDGSSSDNTTSLASIWEATGDAAYKEKLDYMIDSMRELQLLSKGKASDFKTACTPSDAAQSKWSTDPETWGEGFISAYSPDQFALLEQYTPYATIWAPYYTMHKLLSGFLDSYVYAGNETGLQIAKDLGLWVYDRLSACTPEQRTKMWAMYIAGEYGGMNEVLARLYEITGDERLLTASRMFDNTVFFNGLAENKDTIQTRHANQHIPQIVGAIHEYAATGDPYYYNVARNFWEMATARYAYSIGGVGTGESFKQPYRQGNNITGSSSRGENCETCAAYNMLKLTRDIYVYDPDNAEYMDYYERTVLNQIAASQSHNTTNSMHNGCTYMLPIDPGQRKTYDSDYGGFTCCNGTGMENHVIYQIAAYAKTDDTLYVNLYMPSTAEWEEKGVTVKQETKFPSEDSKLTVSGSGSFKMKIRVPYWATAGFTVKVNGQVVCTAPEPSSYVEIDRAWADGDVVDIHMPYTLYLDKNLIWHTLVQAYSRTNRVDKVTKQFGQIITFRNIKKWQDDALRLFSGDGDPNEYLLENYEYYVQKWLSQVPVLRRVTPTVEDAGQLQSEDEIRIFIIAFRALVGTLATLKTFSKFDWADLAVALGEEEYEGYKSWYLYYKDQQPKINPPVPVPVDIDFDVELVRTDRINVVYILNLLKTVQKNRQTQDIDADLDLILREIERSDNESLRAKKEIMVDFIRTRFYDLAEDADIMAAFEEFAQEHEKAEIEEFAYSHGIDYDVVHKNVVDYVFTGKITDEKIRESLADYHLGLLKTTRLTSEIKTFVADTCAKYSAEGV